VKIVVFAKKLMQNSLTGRQGELVGINPISHRLSLRISTGLDLSAKVSWFA
jgi:hypothetical protein